MGSKRKSMSTEEESSHDGAKRIAVVVKSQMATREVHYRIRETCRLHKLLMAYCNSENFDYKTLRFLYKGNRISAKHTPRSLQMKNGAEIDAMSESDGGGAAEC